MSKYYLGLGAALLLSAGCGDNNVSRHGLIDDFDTAEICRFAMPVANGTRQFGSAAADCEITVSNETGPVVGLEDSAGRRVTVPITEILEPQEISLTESVVSPVARHDAETGLWRNVHALFIVQAPNDANMCLAVENWSPDGKTNSLFVLRSGDLEPVQFNLKISETEHSTSRFFKPVVTAGQTGIVAILARERQSAVASVTFRECAIQG